MSIYGICHELEKGGDIPFHYDNTAEYWDACDLESLADGSGLIPEFKCDGCGEWLPVDDHQPHVYDDGHLVLCANCDEELD